MEVLGESGGPGNCKASSGSSQEAWETTPTKNNRDGAGCSLTTQHPAVWTGHRTTTPAESAL